MRNYLKKNCDGQMEYLLLICNNLKLSVKLSLYETVENFPKQLRFNYH